MQGADILAGAARQIGEAVDGPKPSLGRIVHYCDAYGQSVAAIVTRVIEGDTVSLTLFYPGSTPSPLDFPVKRGRGPSTWSWPERV